MLIKATECGQTEAVQILPSQHHCSRARREGMLSKCTVSMNQDRALLHTSGTASYGELNPSLRGGRYLKTCLHTLWLHAGVGLAAEQDSLSF